MITILTPGYIYKKPYTIELLYINPYFVYYSLGDPKEGVSAKHETLYTFDPDFICLRKASKEEILLYASRCKKENIRKKLKKLLKDRL